MAALVHALAHREMIVYGFSILTDDIELLLELKIQSPPIYITQEAG